MKWPFLLASILTGTAWAQSQSGPPSTLSLPQQNGGAATFYSGNRIGQSQSPTILNGYLDADAAVVKRNGYQVYGAIAGCNVAQTGGWSYTSLQAVNYFFVQCGGQMYVTDGNGSFAAIGAQISTIHPVRATVSLGYIWFTDGIDDLWYSDGVHVTSVTTAPYAELIGTYQNRLVLSNITGGPNGSGFTAAQSGTWLSGFENGTDYSLPAIIVDTSAAFFPLNGANDTRQVTCEFDGFKNVEILWNNGQMWGLYGTGNSSFAVQLISNEIGCTDQGTVQEYNGQLFFLSKRGLEGFNGTSINLLSWPIQNQIQTLGAAEKNTQQDYLHTQADWQAGNLTASGPGAPLSATINPGTVVPSTWSYQFSQQQSTAGFYLANAVNNAGRLVPAGLLPNIGFEMSGFENANMTNWTSSVSTTCYGEEQGDSTIVQYGASSVVLLTGASYPSCPSSVNEANLQMQVLNASNSSVISSVAVPCSSFKSSTT